MPRVPGATVAYAPVNLALLSPQAALPSPTTAVWQIGPFPIRAYALCIVLGIVVACAVTEVRLRRRGVAPWAALDLAVWAVPSGIIGARLYHVITSPQGYFGEGGDPVGIIRIWEGGLGIWGAVAGGALGAWFAARQLGIPLAVVADALAPGLPLAQAVGRLGNWFNNELYGGQTTLPWGLRINQMEGGKAIRDGAGNPVTEPGLYHPTFAYEALWNIAVAVFVWLVDRRLKLGRGRAFALYVMGYTAGRFWIEMMRTDEANLIAGVRVNVWVAALVFLGALGYFVRVRGPRQYLIPSNATAPETAGGPRPTGTEPSASGSAGVDATESDADREQGSGGVSQVKLDRAAREDAASGPPPGYRVVSEEEFEAYRQSGTLPAWWNEPATAADAEEPADGAGSSDAGASGAKTDGGADGAAEPGDAASDDRAETGAAGSPDRDR